jgi:dihydrofolate reductase
MADLVYSCITSLDGYINDEQGRFEWAEPDQEVHAFVNECERPIGTHLYGRRMYETMAYWEDPPPEALETPVYRDYTQIWQAADKVVYSTTLANVSTARTRLVAAFDPDAVRELKASATSDLSIGGPALAAHALRAGLVDVLQLFVAPVVVGGGTPWLPDGVRLDLALVDEHRFARGFAHLHYRVVGGRDATGRR